MDVITTQSNLEIVPITDPVSTIDCSPDNIHMVCGLWSILRIYDLRTFEQIGSNMIGHRQPVRIVKYSPRGDLITSGSDDLVVRVWDSKTQTQIQNISITHKKRVTCLPFSSDGHCLASGSQDKSIIITNLSEQSKIQYFETICQGNVYLKELEPSDGYKLISHSSNDSILIWDLRTMQCRQFNQYKVHSIRYLNREVVIFGSKDNQLKLFVERTGKLIRKLCKLAAHKLALAPDRKSVVTTNLFLKTMLLLSLETGKIIGCLTLDWAVNIHNVMFAKDGKSIITTDSDKILKITKIEAFQNCDI